MTQLSLKGFFIYKMILLAWYSFHRFLLSASYTGFLYTYALNWRSSSLLAKPSTTLLPLNLRISLKVANYHTIRAPRKLISSPNFNLKSYDRSCCCCSPIFLEPVNKYIKNADSVNSFKRALFNLTKYILFCNFPT